MNPNQLRQALHELNGERDLAICFADIHIPATGAAWVEVKNAVLIPDEEDHLIKVTDGKHVFIIDPDRIAYIRIALKKLA
jgi:hypothetical protein